MRVRVLQERDVALARRVFANGMHETISSGGRKAPMLHVFAAIASLLVAGLMSLAAGGLAVGLAIVITQCAIVGLWPWRLARNYVSKSLSQDMLDPVRHYCQQDHGRSCFFVAVDGDDRVVGTVAVEPPQCEHAVSSSSPWSSAGHQAELRRMSVATTHRGRGVSKMLLAEVKRFCVDKGYEQLVLSTSTMQRVAVKAYPKMGFATVQVVNYPSDLVPLVQIHFFLLPLSSKN